MLDIVIPEQEFFDEEKNEFIYMKSISLKMEHSLISVSKWESKWHKAFLSKRERSSEETLDYFRCMTINQVDPVVFNWLSAENIDQIVSYINEPMTAVYIAPDEEKGHSRDTTTSELLYYYMIALGIPFECEKWHLNRLLSLIHVCQIKSQPPKSVNKASIARRNHQLNAARRKKYHTKG